MEYLYPTRRCMSCNALVGYKNVKGQRFYRCSGCGRDLGHAGGSQWRGKTRPGKIPRASK